MDLYYLDSSGLSDILGQFVFKTMATPGMSIKDRIAQINKGNEETTADVRNFRKPNKAQNSPIPRGAASRPKPALAPRPKSFRKGDEAPTDTGSPQSDLNSSKSDFKSPKRDHDSPKSEGRTVPSPSSPDRTDTQHQKPIRPPIPPLPDETQLLEKNSAEAGSRKLPPTPLEKDKTPQKPIRPPIPPLPGETPASKSPKTTNRRIPSPPPNEPGSDSDGDSDCSTSNQDYILPDVPPRATKGSNRSIKVSGFDKSVTSEALKLHFENNLKSDGGPVESVHITNGEAVVCFKQEKDAKRVLNASQTFRQKTLKVSSLSDAVQTTYLVSGMSPTTSKDQLKDHLESTTKFKVDGLFNVSVEYVSVTFSGSSTPEMTQLQNALKDAPLDGCYLILSTDDDDDHDYIEPVEELTLSVTGEKLKYLQKFKMAELIQELNKLNVTITVDMELFELTLKGKNNDLKQGEIYMQRMMGCLVVNEHSIAMPGIKSFLQADDTLAKIAEIETKEKCAIFYVGNIYETIDFGESFTDSDSNPSGGSFIPFEIKDTEKSTPKTELSQADTKLKEGDYRMLQHSETMATFQIGKCQFQLKQGNIQHEEVECVVNITKSEFEHGDLWTTLSQTQQQELKRQLAMPTLLSEWNRKGTVLSTVSDLPCKFVIHVKQAGGDLHKVFRKTLQAVKTSEVKSLAFYSVVQTDQNDEVYPSFLKTYLDEIHRYQKSSHPEVKDIRLVLDNLQETFITGVRQEMENLLVLSKKPSFMNNLRNKIFSRIRSGSNRDETNSETDSHFHTFIDNKQDELPSPEQDAEVDGAELPLEGADAEMCICSYSQDFNIQAAAKLDAYCQKNMKPKVIDNPKIKKLTESQIKIFRKRAGRFVEVEVNTDTGQAEIRGFKKDVDSVYAKLKQELEKIPDSPTPESDDQENEEDEATPSQPLQENRLYSDNRIDDEYDILGKHIAIELRGITDDAKRLQAKRAIQKILLDAQS